MLDFDLAQLYEVAYQKPESIREKKSKAVPTRFHVSTDSKRMGKFEVAN